MVLHVRDAETDAKARELARLKGVSITEAVGEALDQALKTERSRLPLWQRTADIRARVASYARTGETVDKSFYDELSGEGDE